MKRLKFINFKNWGGYERFINERLAVPTFLLVFLLPFVLTACEKEVIDPTPPTDIATRADTTDTTSSGDSGGMRLNIDTTWADTIHICWDSLGTDTTTSDSTIINPNTDISEDDAGGAASRLKK